MRISATYLGAQAVHDTDGATLIVGRPRPGAGVDVDLSPDQNVSRPHAKVWRAGDAWWIEDLGSTRGTKVNGEQIKGLGKWRLTGADVVTIGETALRFDLGETGRPADAPGPAEAAVAAGGAPEVSVEAVLDDTERYVVKAGRVDARLAARLTFLCDLPATCALHEPLDAMLQFIVEQIVQVFPGAARSIVLIRDERSGELLLKAHVPPGRPSVSLTLARRALETRQAFIWRRQEDLSVSQQLLGHSGIYAPLVWKDEALGVMALDATDRDASFGDEDLRLLAAIARHLAAEIAHDRLRVHISQKNALLERLLTNFSPAVRDRLVHKARHGKLRLGGEKSEVTLLCSDIRNFTRLSEALDADDVADMLNDYFGPFVRVIFTRGGTVDKFVGDAILAVFGSPEEDAQSDLHAVQAALEMQAAAQQVNQRRSARRQPCCQIGIGIHRGIVLHGFIGSEERVEYTVIGDAVNRTSRFCDGAQAGEILVSPDVHQRIWRAVTAELRDIPTKHEGMFKAYLVTGAKAE